MKELNRLKEVRAIGGYRLQLAFDDGATGEVDLAPLVENPRGPLEEELKDPALFQRVECDGYTAVWPNGYDLCPDTLRYWCERGQVCSQEELDSAFTSSNPLDRSAFVLNEKPAA